MKKSNLVTGTIDVGQLAPRRPSKGRKWGQSESLSDELMTEKKSYDFRIYYCQIRYRNLLQANFIHKFGFVFG